jgi:rhodanese-related sulfurtransferase
MMNKGGYASFASVLAQGDHPLSPEEFEHLANTEEALVLDVRDREDFSAAHVPNSIYIGIDGQFAPWVGALIVDIKQPILLIAPEGRSEEVVTRLSRVGYDNELGYLKGGVAAWEASGRETDSIKNISAADLEELVNVGKADEVLDTRKPTEFLSEHLLIAENYPLDYINGKHINELDREKTYYLHCGSGYRSLIAASILRARGFQHLVNVRGGWAAVKETGLAKSDYQCPTGMTQETIDEAVSAVL